ncbi:ADP-ribosylation factor-binding protein GGA [Mytilus galloprovincialis]|uniref:ADP-ribosylation factor-binding protein GGA n=1 Tax=Mytilus galloprovincialis TaxID=29158 RepID=A0A8B6GKH9_MYTGA|nr:ADP-ribosylation factor-binding protein GGA [Mytilus galloprovincialis]
MAEEDRSLETLLNRATNPANRDEDWEHILAFCDQVNKEIEGSQIAVKLLAHKLQSPQEREALYALTTLEGCVKNCGKKFHQEIGKFRFLNEIIKVVSPKYLGKATTEKVKRRCIELIYSWSRGLPQEAKILDAYKMLKQQGVVKEDPTYIDKTLDTFPPPQPREKNAIFEDDDKANLLQKLLRSKNPQDLQAANRLIKNMVKQDTERMDKISRRINQLQEIDNNVKLLNEMLAHYTKQNSSQSDRDMMKELYDTLEKLRPNLFRLASDVDEKDNTGIADILTTNDDAMRVLASYKKIVEGSTSDESNLAFLRAGAGNLSSLLDLNEPSSPAKPDTSTAPSTDILDEELLALGLGDSKTDDPNKSTTLLGDLDDIFSAVTQQNTVPASQTGLQTTNIFSMPSMQGGTFQSQPLNQFNTGQPTQLSTQQVQRPPQYNNQGFSQPQQPSQGWSFQGTPTVAPSQQNKTAQQSTTTTSMGDIDLLGQSLMQQSLPKEYIKPIIPPPEKKTLNQMSTKTTDGPLLATVSPFTTSQTTVTLSSPVISSTTATPVTTPKQGEVQPLNDVFVSIESVQPGTSPPINAYDKNGMKIVIHIAKNRPREDVHVMVVSVMSTNTSAVKNFSFQAAVPKAMKVKLQPPSATDLPLYNPILPPAAITQIMLLANPQNYPKERIRLKFKITYSLDSESRSDVGEVDNFVFS